MTLRLENARRQELGRASHLRRLACLLERRGERNAAAELRAIASIFSKRAVAIFSERALSIKHRKGTT